tara:strand:+ start:19057 stop:19254 length:198 start_codon:yes stop_codon:yes gene_type:complete
MESLLKRGFAYALLPKEFDLFFLFAFEIIGRNLESHFKLILTKDKSSVSPEVAICTTDECVCYPS